MDVHQRVTGLDEIAFMDINLHYSSGKLAGNTDRCSVGLTFDYVLRLIKETETEYRKHYADDHHYAHSHHEYLIFALFGSSSGAVFYI